MDSLVRGGDQVTNPGFRGSKSWTPVPGQLAYDIYMRQWHCTDIRVSVSAHMSDSVNEP